MGLFVSTVSTDVAISELGIVLSHPTIDYDLASQFSGADIKRAMSLTAAVQGGTLTWRKVAAGAVQTAVSYDPDYWHLQESNLGPGDSQERGVLFKDISTLFTSASPGFTWARSGNTPSNTWLLNDSVPSNITGRIVFLNSAMINKIFVSNQNISTYTVGIYSHDGDGINLALLGSVTVTAARGGEFTVNWAVAKNKQIALRITSGSVANVVAGAIIAGSLA